MNVEKIESSYVWVAYKTPQYAEFYNWLQPKERSKELKLTQRKLAESRVVSRVAFL